MQRGGGVKDEVTLIPKEIPADGVSIWKDYNGYSELTSGVIHSYFRNANGYKAVIPANTPIYIDDDLKSIASEKLIIYQEKPKKEHLTITQNLIFDEILKKENVKGDKNGIVVDGKTIALQENTFKWQKGTLLKVGNLDEDVVTKDNINNFPAYKYCEEYNEDGTWRLPTTNELKSIFSNMLYFNVMVEKLSSENIVATKLSDNNSYWSSEEADSIKAKSVSSKTNEVVDKPKNFALKVRPIK